METTPADTFGRAAAEARRAKGWTQADLAEAADISKPTVQRLERGAPVRPRTWKVHLAVAQALGWTPESVEVVWDGGEPVLATDAPPASESATPPRGLPAGLSERAERALGSGRVVDSTVIATPDDGTLVVIRVESGVSPEQLQRDMVRWRRMQEITDVNFDRLMGEAHRLFSGEREGVEES